MMKRTHFALAACLACTLASVQAQSAQPGSPTQEPLQAIAAVDVARYMGNWYEIAKYPNRFQKQCVAETLAQYQLLPTGKVQVINRCRTASGEMDVAEGEARQIGSSTSAKLQVRFAPAWLSLLPFVWGDYWIIDLDGAYQLAAVSEPSRDYLWILSRTPTVNPEAYDALMARLDQMGFDLNRLQRTPQKP